MSLSVILFLIIGILCVLYGIMVLLIRSGTTFFVVWFALGAFFLLLGFLVQYRLLDKLPKILRTLFLIAVCAVILMLAVCEGFVLRGFGSRAPAGLDYLIVLGAQVREDGPSAVLKYRLDAAAQYLLENDSTLCIVTGAKGTSEPFSEDQVMKDYLVKAGISEDRIIGPSTLSRIFSTARPLCPPRTHPLRSSPTTSTSRAGLPLHAARD